MNSRPARRSLSTQVSVFIGSLMITIGLLSCQQSPPPIDMNTVIASASHTHDEANIDATADGVIGSSSRDYRVARHTFYPKKGTTEWLQYEFSEPTKIGNAAVYWVDEGQTGEVVLPKSWKLQYLSGEQWKAVEISGKYGVVEDRYNFVEFAKAIETQKLRLEVQLYAELSAGVLEWGLNLPQKAEEASFADPDQELQRIKEKASAILALDVDEFNGYAHLNGNRPEFDGWLNKENNHEFLQNNIPKFLCSDEDFTEVFNYRWWMITKRLKEWEEAGEKFYVFTEFPGFPGWASKSGAIPAPAGHQYYDLRWMRDPKYLKSYAKYWFTGPPATEMQRQNNNWLGTLPRPQSHHYTSWMIDAAEAMLKIHPDTQWRDELLPAMERHQAIWDLIFKIDAPGKFTDGLYKCLDIYDANEFTISTTLGLIAAKGAYVQYNTTLNAEEPYKGQEQWRRYFTDGRGWRAAYKEGLRNKTNVYPQPYNLENYTTQPQAFGGNHRKASYPNLFTARPSLNCYMYGNYQSLARLYNMKAAETQDGVDKQKSEQYAAVAETLKQKIVEAFWHKPKASDGFQFYGQRGAIDDPFFYTRLAGDNRFTGGVVDQLSMIRETVGYTPWYFNMLPAQEDEYDIAWKQLDDPNGFKQPFGLSTAEYRHDYFNELSYGWNGRGWPFQNSVVNKSYANYLRNYKGTRDKITEEDRQLLYHHISQYVALHGRRRSIGEWYMPREGGYQMSGSSLKNIEGQGKGFGGVQDYFHSTFPDMLIEDLLGFSPSHEDGFTLQPLLPEDEWDYFYLGDLRYHDRDVDIIWKKDWDVNKSGNQSQLVVWVDGKIIAQSDALNEKLEVSLP